MTMIIAGFFFCDVVLTVVCYLWDCSIIYLGLFYFIFHVGFYIFFYFTYRHFYLHAYLFEQKQFISYNIIITNRIITYQIITKQVLKLSNSIETVSSKFENYFVIFICGRIF